MQLGFFWFGYFPFFFNFCVADLRNKGEPNSDWDRSYSDTKFNVGRFESNSYNENN